MQENAAEGRGCRECNGMQRNVGNAMDYRGMQQKVADAEECRKCKGCKGM